MGSCRGQTWFLAALGNGPARPLRVPLGFLSKGAYQATLLSDTPGQQASATERSQVMSAADVRPLTLNANGGFLARFTPQ